MQPPADALREEARGVATAAASNPFSVAFGLPLALAVACGLFGLMLGTAGDVEVVDAPVRMARFRRLVRAATSERGQLPGSPVPPRTPYDRPRS